MLGCKWICWEKTHVEHSRNIQNNNNCLQLDSKQHILKQNEISERNI